MVKATMFTLTNYDSLAKQTAHNVIPYSRIDASVNNRMAGFIFYSIIKVFNLGQQFYTQNDQNAISRAGRIGNLFEIDMGGAHGRSAASRLCSLVNDARAPPNGVTPPPAHTSLPTLVHCHTVHCRTSLVLPTR